MIMHRVLPPRPHGVVDYALVVLLVLAPSWLAFGGVPAVASYVLAATHLALSLATAYPLGLFRVIPFPAHGQLELIIGSALVVLPWFLAFEGDGKAQWFFIVLGLAVLLVYALTDYRMTADERLGPGGVSPT
jgi:hypothetical protein